MDNEAAVRDSVFPVVAARQATNGTYEVTALLGTAFLLKDRGGLAVTAGHVADSVDDAAGGMFVVDGASWFVGINDVQRHDRADLAFLQMNCGDRGSPFEMSPNEHHSSSAFHAWGYAVDAQYDGVNQLGRQVLRPELVYARGYVRRRMTDVDRTARWGRRLYELNAPIGNGCSGAPLVRVSGYASDPWYVIGVYVGQTSQFEGSKDQPTEPMFGYAVRVAGERFFADVMGHPSRAG